MKLAHLADLHLGFRQYTRQNVHGINQREADVGEAFRRAIDDLIKQRPDLIVIAGDIFHSVRPTNSAILFAFRELQRLRTALPGSPVVMVAGDHDTPRSVETGSILKLYEILGVEVVESAPRRLEFADLDTSVLAVPHQALVSGARPALRPAGSRSIQMLVTHGEITGLLGDDRSAIDYGGAQVALQELGPEMWTYAALGHYHVAHQIRPSVWYSGSLEFVTTHPWSELRVAAAAGHSGKGYLLVDLPNGEPEFRRIGPVREHIDLPAIHGAGLSADVLDTSISELIHDMKSSIDDRVVRLVVWDVPRQVARELNHAKIRDYKTRALHFKLDIRRPAPTRPVGVGAPGRQTLPEMLRHHLKRIPLDAEIDRKAFVSTGLAYLDHVMRAEDGS